MLTSPTLVRMLVPCKEFLSSRIAVGSSLPSKRRRSDMDSACTELSERGMKASRRLGLVDERKPQCQRAFHSEPNLSSSRRSLAAMFPSTKLAERSLTRTAGRFRRCTAGCQVPIEWNRLASWTRCIDHRHQLFHLFRSGELSIHAKSHHRHGDVTPGLSLPPSRDPCGCKCDRSTVPRRRDQTVIRVGKRGKASCCEAYQRWCSSSPLAVEFRCLK